MAGEVAQAQYTCQCEAAGIDIGLRSVLCSCRCGLTHGSGRDGRRIIGSSRSSSSSSGRTNASKVDRRLKRVGGCRGSSCGRHGCGYILNISIRSASTRSHNAKGKDSPGVVAAAGGAKDREEDNAAGADDTAAGGAAAGADGAAAETAGGAAAALGVVV